MKKIMTRIVPVLAIVCLTGCADASAKLKNGNTSFFTIGKETITKNEMYQAMKATAGGSLAIRQATKTIANLEVEITDEMKAEAQKTLDNFKTLYGDNFMDLLNQNGTTQDEYIENILIPSLQSKELVKKYINDNFDTLVAKYKPTKATILTFTTADDANNALTSLKDGSKTPADLVNEYNLTSSTNPEMITIESKSYDSTLLSAIFNSSTDEGWIMLPNTDSSKFHVLSISENNATNMKDEVIETFSSISDINKESTTHFFQKYNFHVYDIDLYKQLLSDYPEYLIQTKITG